MVAIVEGEAAALEQASAPPAFALRRRSDLYRFAGITMVTASVQSPLGIYLPAYYGGYVGMAIGQVGLAFLIVRLFDISFDPLMGMMLDRTRTRFGQARPWMLAGLVLMTIATPWLFLAPKGVGVVYFVAGMLVIYAGFSMASLAFAAWSSRLVRDYSDRNRIWGWTQVFGYIGTFLVFAAPLLFAKNNAVADGADIHIMGWILMIGAPVVAFVALVGVPEPPVPATGGVAAQRVKLSDYVELLKLSSVRTIVLTDLILTVASGTTAILFLLFWQFARGYSRPEGTELMLAYMVAGFLGTPVWIRIAKKIGKKGALMASLACYGVLIPGMAIAPRNHMDIIGPGQFLLGLSYASGIFLLRSMAADAADEIRLKLNKDRTGQLFGLFGSTAKVGTAAAALYALGLLQVAGFDAKRGLANTPQAMTALNLLYLVAPGILMFVGAIILAPYKLNRREHDRVLAELAERDEAERRAQAIA